MLNKLDPHQPVDHEIGGVTYTVRALTAREMLKFIPRIKVEGNKFRFSPELIDEILDLALLGWNAEDVPFDTENMKANIDRLGMPELVGLTTKILHLSSAEFDKKKLNSQPELSS